MNKFINNIWFFNLEYLKKIHYELFKSNEELNNIAGKISKRYNNKEDYQELINVINEINNSISSDFNISKILDSLQKLWYLQPFDDGNTRTIYCLAKIIMLSRNYKIRETHITSGTNSIKALVYSSKKI